MMQTAETGRLFRSLGTALIVQAAMLPGSISAQPWRSHVAPVYSVTEIGPPPSLKGVSEVATHLTAMNNRGQVAGISTDGRSTSVPFVWDRGGYTELAVWEFDEEAAELTGVGWVHDINDLGAVVGESPEQAPTEPFCGTTAC